MAIAFGLLVNFVVPAPAGITSQAWTLFSVFLSTILGLVLQPLPVGAWAFLGLCVVVATKTLPFAKVRMDPSTHDILVLEMLLLAAKALLLLSR
jgi:DASS family divalent anion:Na+ symporter